MISSFPLKWHTRLLDEHHQPSLMNQHHVNQQSCGTNKPSSLDEKVVYQEITTNGIGLLRPLKTTLELRARDELIKVYIARIPAKVANVVLELVRSIGNATDLQHLRRFVKLNDLPSRLRPLLLETTAIAEVAGLKSTDLYAVIGPTSSIGMSQLQDSLLEILQEPKINEVVICSTVVPLLAPTSQQQATSWSESHWPTVYKKSNPFGPHPSLISRAECEIVGNLPTWMDLAIQVAARSRSEGYGAAIGAVIVERSGTSSHAVALAGDGRWKGQLQDGVGNVMAHAVLRAIGMIARKLQAVTSESSGGIAERDAFLDHPLFTEEQMVFDSGQISPDGYLCHGLEIYLTHEPCIMCSMALLHSRFGKVIFGQSMPRTGGLSSDISGLGHGLFWRRELNWSFLAWEATIDQGKRLIIDIEPLTEV